MKKNVYGIFGLLVAVFAITAIADPNFLSAYNMQNTVKWSSLYGVMSIGVAFVNGQFQMSSRIEQSQFFAVFLSVFFGFSLVFSGFSFGFLLFSSV